VPGYDYWVPMILTIPALCVALFSPVAGLLGDRFGRRRLLIGSFVVYGVVGIAPVFLQDLTAILISRVGVGLAEALIMVLSTTMIGDCYQGAARDKWLAGQTAFASMSALIFFNVGGRGAGWRMPFWVYSSALVMMALVILFTREPKGEGRPRRTVRHGAGRLSLGPLGRIMAITLYGSVFFYTVQIQASRGLNAAGRDRSRAAGFLTSSPASACRWVPSSIRGSGGGRCSACWCWNFPCWRWAF
jgi:MFS family permease